MRLRTILTAGLAVAAVMAGLSGTAKADPKDYRFEAADSQIAVSPASAIAVRLIHLPDGKPVAGAVVFQPRMEMPMGNLAPMPTTVTPGTPDGKGGYPFTADITMAGPWTLTVSAKVQGEAGTITGTIPFTAAQTSHGHNH